MHTASNPPQQNQDLLTHREEANQIANQTLQSIDKRLEDLGRLYGTLGFSGFVTVVGAAILISTIVVAFQTIPGSQTSGLLSIDRQEEVMFLIASLFLMMLGGLSFAFRTYLEYRLEALRVDINVKRIEAIRSITGSGVEALEEDAGGRPSLPKG